MSVCRRAIGAYDAICLSTPGGNLVVLPGVAPLTWASVRE
jgi:hypothetical protein